MGAWMDGESETVNDIRRTAVLARDEAIAAGVLSVGAHSYGEPTVLMHRPGNAAKVRVGKYCSIAAGVRFMVGGNHRTDRVTTYPMRLKFGDFAPNPAAATKGDIVIGHDVWIGLDVRILSGVTIGNGAVIGADATVGGDVRPYAVVVGNPAREVRRRFSADVVEALQRIAWWDWPEEAIRSRVDQLCSSDVEAFARRYDPISSPASSSSDSA